MCRITVSDNAASVIGPGVYGHLAKTRENCAALNSSTARTNTNSNARSSARRLPRVYGILLFHSSSVTIDAANTTERNHRGTKRRESTFASTKTT